MPLGNLQQSIHLALPPATLTFPRLHTTPSTLLPGPPTPTLIIKPQTTPTTPTPPYQTKPLLPLSHPSYSQNNHTWKRQKTLLTPHPQSLPPQPQPPPPHHVRSYHLPQEITFQKDKTTRPDNYSQETLTHTQSIHCNQNQAKMSQKISSSIRTPQD